MPNLEQATRPIDRTGLISIASPPAAPIAVFAQQQFPANPNPFLRCPIPPIAATPDNLRQYYAGGVIPQNRIMTPASLSQSTGGGGTTIESSSTSSSSTTPTTPSKIGTVQLASITTPVLNPGGQYQTVLSTSTSFIPILVSTTAIARVELYATASAQSVDMTRPITQSPGPSTQQGIFLDVSLNVSPLSWLVTPTLPCVNGNSPQKPLSYITVTNTGVSSTTITATVQYLILEI